MSREVVSSVSLKFATFIFMNTLIDRIVPLLHFNILTALASFASGLADGKANI